MACPRVQCFTLHPREQYDRPSWRCLPQVTHPSLWASDPPDDLFLLWGLSLRNTTWEELMMYVWIPDVFTSLESSLSLTTSWYELLRICRMWWLACSCMQSWQIPWGSAHVRHKKFTTALWDSVAYEGSWEHLAQGLKNPVLGDISTGSHSTAFGTFPSDFPTPCLFSFPSITKDPTTADRRRWLGLELGLRSCCCSDLN
mmetsp:Transcript_86/g.204  ORF Transcript_86/g.204 Transcript_86/m.204 type:complete len:200 (-) Transcript_86:294-893(-)